MRARIAVALLLLLGACKAPKEKWIEQFEPRVTDALCVPQQFFRQCFELEEQRCKQMLRPLVHSCIEEVRSQIPDEMSKEDGASFGEQIGACAGGRFGTKLDAEAKRRNDPRCSDPNAWTNPQ